MMFLAIFATRRCERAQTSVVIFAAADYRQQSSCDASMKLRGLQNVVWGLWGTPAEACLPSEAWKHCCCCSVWFFFCSWAAVMLGHGHVRRSL